MSYNQNELKAMLMIAKKLGWHKPASETLEIINQMVRNQQSLELDTVGECDDYEETLLSMALWSADKIVSTQFVSDYHSLNAWLFFCEEMHLDGMSAYALVTLTDQVKNAVAELYEAEDAFAHLASEYNDADWADFAAMTRESWIRNNCY